MQDEVRAQDTVFVIVSVAESRYGRDLAWQFFKENWQEFMNRYQVSYTFICQNKGFVVLICILPADCWYPQIK